ncbi:PREDICTED: TRAF3-interacting protein 1 isoform X2 [Myotis davidii]|uniref:TRAF3-interacting protein 1 isoform X2 n=1 Tax=Myotis davidii TaxID=225400 RepID=UPI0003EBCC40|nr:PREDICTED: TRAF3-interacting protein 1 isoform X2 [Myotis davidii]
MTGFMKGLYTEAEMKSDNVKDKDAKISFLQKAIDVVAMVSGEPLSAKPARIVAGHEPERTNELLQRIGKCCLSKLSSDDAVKRVLAGEKDVKGRASLTSKPQEPDNRNVREEEPRVPKDEEGRRNSEINERSTSRDRKQKEELREESKQREKERDKEKTKENDRDRHKDSERDKGREGERERTRTRARPDRDRDRGNRDRDRDVDRARERKNEGGKEKERWKDREKERERDKGRDRDRDRRRVKNGEHSRDPVKEKSREHDKPEKKSSSSGEMSKKLSDGSFKDSKAETEPQDGRSVQRGLQAGGPCSACRRSDDLSGLLPGHTAGECNPPVSCVDPWASLKLHLTEVSSRAPRSVATKTSKRLSKTSLEGDSPSVSEGEAGPISQEKSEVPANAEVPPELPSGARRIPRPGSARPAPPRVKRQDSAEVLTADRTGSGQTVSNVIVDVQNSENEEDDQFVVEAAPPLSEVSELEVVPAVELEEDEKHGGLVKKILETKKDYEKLQLPPKPGEKEKSLALESAWKKEKDIVSKEIEKLRLSIQTLCKSALPLGKIMDYLQEDADAMQNELQLWHQENQQHAEALQKEQSITDSAVEPLKVELAELEQLIKDQQDKICAVKANILKNEEKIQKMVYSINLSSRR